MGDNDAKNLLKSYADNLLSAFSRLENCPQEQRQSLKQGSTPSVSEEHSRLFGYRPPNNSRTASSSSRTGRQLAPKRQLLITSTGERITIPVPNTWTTKFMCLEKRNATTAPSTIENGYVRAWREKHMLLKRWQQWACPSDHFGGFPHARRCWRLWDSQDRRKGQSWAGAFVNTTLVGTLLLT